MQKQHNCYSDIGVWCITALYWHFSTMSLPETDPLLLPAQGYGTSASPLSLKTYFSHIHTLFSHCSSPCRYFHL